MAWKVEYADAQGRRGIVDLGPGPCYIGRALDCAIVTDDAHVSRKHAIVRRDGARYVIEDLGSATGVHVNGMKVATHVISPDDVVRCGSLWLRFIEVPDHVATIAGGPPRPAPSGGQGFGSPPQPQPMGQPFGGMPPNAKTQFSPFVSPPSLPFRAKGGRKASWPAADPVDCTVFAPPRAIPGASLLVQAFVHIADDAAVAAALAREHDADAARLGFRSLELDVERGVRLAFHLAFPALTIDDPVQHLRWNGRTTSVTFGVSVPAGITPGARVGSLDVSLEDVPLGKVKFKLEILAGAVAEKPAAMGDEARAYRKAFVSYASSDRDEVLKRVQILRACRIAFFQDVLDLEPGDRWERELYHRIEECDLFLLFWSEASRRSEWVQREVRYALATSTPDIVPIILEGPPVPPPPPELAHLHFNDRLIHFLSR